MSEATTTDQTVCLISAVLYVCLVLEHEVSVDLQAGLFAFYLSPWQMAISSVMEGV